MLEIANVRAIILMTQDDDYTDREISHDNSEDHAESTLSSDIEDDDFDNQQDVLYLDQAQSVETLHTTGVPLPKKRSRADTAIARTSLPHLQHPAGAIAPPLLKWQKSTINILRESDIVPAQALPLAQAGRDQCVPQLKSGGDHNIHQPQMATFEVAKQFMEPNVFTKTPSPIISHDKCSMVDRAWPPAIKAEDHPWALAGAPVGTPCVCQLPGA